MTSVIEPILALQFIASELTGSAPLMAIMTGGAHEGTAPGSLLAAVPFKPFILVEEATAIPDLQLNDERVWATLEFKITLVDLNSRARTAPAGTIVDTLLQSRSEVISGGRIVSCVRRNAYLDEEIVNGLIYKKLVTLWRLEVRSE